MNKSNALKVFYEWDNVGRYIFTLRDISKLFPDDKPKTLQASVNRFVKDGILKRAAKGVYVFGYARNTTYVIERVAIHLRRGEYSYVSLESALSEYGAISQIPVDRLTIMTSGRKGEHKTPYGVIEFTHTDKSQRQILQGTINSGRPLRYAKIETALRDLKRVGRNLHLLEEID